MDNSFSEAPIRIQLNKEVPEYGIGHPWLSVDDLSSTFAESPTPCSATVYLSNGDCLGSGIYDPRDVVAPWRRFSWEPGACFDSNYLAEAIQSSLERRSDDACQRLIHSDADYIPGLIVEIYNDVLWIQVENAAVEAQMELIIELFTELVAPREIVLDGSARSRIQFGLDTSIRTVSGQNLKGFWLEIDEVFYRLDLLNAEKPRFYLDLREQHSLVGSLCAERRVLDLFANQGSFALQAMRHGASEATAVDLSSDALKSIGANAQKNQLVVRTVEADALTYLENSEAGAHNCIILDPPADIDAQTLAELNQQAFRILEQGGVLATYCRHSEVDRAAFETMISQAAAKSGRDGRIFARISQPFDFPVLLNLPESAHLKGLILQVE